MSLTRRQLLAASAAVPLGAQPRRPNLVFIISDDHHFQAMGAAGNPHIRTPHLDRLCARGLHFTNGVISTAQCAPSRGVLLSGLESYQNGIQSNGQIAFKPGLGPTVVQQLKTSGYDTALVGKWHIRNQPAACGFAKMPLWLPAAASPYTNPRLRRGDGPLEPVEGHMTDLLTDAAIEYVRGAKGPFLLWLAYTAPHTPWGEPARYKAPYAGKGDGLAAPAHPKGGGKFDWETYYAVISHLDEAVGRFIGELEKAGHWDNTLVVFLGDNGYLCGTKGLQGKVECWDESIRVPYLVSGGAVKRTGKDDTPVASIDVPATFLDYAGVKPAYALAGESLRPLIEGRRMRRDAAFSVWNDGRPDALMVPRAVEPYRVVRGRTHKYVLWESKKQALFDLRADPAEEKNLADDPAHAATLKQFRERLRARARETSDPALAWLG